MSLRTTGKAAAWLVVGATLFGGCRYVPATSDRIYSRSTPTNEERLNYGRIGVAVGRFDIEYASNRRLGKYYVRRSDRELTIRQLINTVVLVLTVIPGPAITDLLDDSRYKTKSWPATPGNQLTMLDNALVVSGHSDSPQQRLGYAIIEQVNTTRTGNIDMIAGCGPNVLAEEVDYSRYAGKYDTILELCITKIGFESFDAAEPRFHLYMNAKVKLVKTAGNAVIYHDLFTYTGEGEPAGHWLSDDRLNMKREIDKGIRYLSWQVSLLLSPSS